VDTHVDLNVYGSFCCIETTQEQTDGKAKSCCGKSNDAEQKSSLENIDINHWVGAYHKLVPHTLDFQHLTQDIRRFQNLRR